MSNEWYYGRGADIVGPLTGNELFDLAADGTILRTDTVWRGNIEAGIIASRVRNLFIGTEPPIQVASVSVLNPIDVANLHVAGTPEPLVPLPVETAPETLPTPPAFPPKAPQRMGRASAGKGAIIMGQDGKTVKFRGKCSTCGREDASWKTIAIPRGVARSSFFCSKCRKRRDVEINGVV